MLSLTHTGVFAVVFAVLVILVNIITQIFKSFLNKSEIPTRIFVLVVSIILTVTAFFAVCEVYSIEVIWYMIAAAVVCGFVVAYCAMFGYDNLYGELTGLLKKLFSMEKGGTDNENN
jgi:hypothetical protein